MKKNIAMRLAAILFILTMISTCAFSSTFAKYVTSDDAADSARVAKWGVVVEMWDDDAESSVFANEYDSSVKHATDRLVAPGTKNEKGITFSITGTPEVKVDVKFEMEVSSDVVVPAGTYLDWTTGKDTDDTYTLDADYTPVVFTLTNDGVAVATGTLADIEGYLEGSTMTKVHDPLSNLSDIYGTYTLTWAWAIDGNDQADTTLGNKAAELTDSTAANVKTNIAFTLKITATQVD